MKRVCVPCVCVPQVWRLCFCVSVLEMLVCAVRAPLGYVSSTWRMADMALIGLQGHYGHTLQRPGEPTALTHVCTHPPTRGWGVRRVGGAYGGRRAC